VLARLESLPGAHSATLASHFLLSNSTSRTSITVPGYIPGSGERMHCNWLIVGPRFFETMNMPLMAGRKFGPQDERPTPLSQAGSVAPSTPDKVAKVLPAPISAVINQTMALHYFGEEFPLGKQFHRGDNTPIEIIGVVKDARYSNLREQPPRTFYLYYSQQPPSSNLNFYLRIVNDAASYTGTIQRLIREIDPQLRVHKLLTMTEAVHETFWRERFIAQVAGAFSLFALLLACIGLYGLMSNTVTRRINEIGIRMALGARRREIVLMIMREVVKLVALGIGIGLAASVTTTHLVSTLLFGLTPTDPTTIALATLLMIGMAALAGYLPARRAAQVEPIVALRHE
jgi:predicted permease